MFIALVIFLEEFIVLSFSNPIYLCNKGTYLHLPRSGPEVCPPCETGKNFMSEDKHRNKNCVSCTQIRDPQVEVIGTECNRTHDTEILCKTGFFRRKARNVREQDQCVKCFECENPTRRCQGYYDTVCCVNQNFIAVLNKDGVYVCKEKPIICKQGQYFSATSKQCLPCPPNTYMPETSHNNTECKLCQTVTNKSHRKRVVIQACNSTHPTIFGCKNGYFRNSPKYSPLSEEDCSQCRTCQFVGRKCNPDYDTVCCDSPLVSDTDTGPVCGMGLTTLSPVSETTIVTVCGEDEYIYTDASDNSVSCYPCPEGSYNDDPNHTRPACKDCSELKDRQLPASCQVGKDATNNTSNDWSTTKIVQCFLSVVFFLIIIAGFTILVIKYRIIFIKNQQISKLKTIFMLGFMLVFAATHLLVVFLPGEEVTIFFSALLILWSVIAIIIFIRKVQMDISKCGNNNLKPSPTLKFESSEPQTLLSEINGDIISGH